MSFGKMNWYICLIIAFYNISKVYSSFLALMLSIVFNVSILVEIQADQNDFNFIIEENQM